jgi:hypothetical protein
MSNSLGHLTEADIRARCTEASFERGQGYYGLGGLPIKGGCQRESNVIYLIKIGNPSVATRRPPGPGELSTQPDLIVSHKHVVWSNGRRFLIYQLGSDSEIQVNKGSTNESKTRFRRINPQQL